MRVRHEYSSTGFDDFLGLVGGDPSGTPEGGGIRIPQLALAGTWYRCLLSVVDLAAGDWLVGFGQHLELWGLVPSNTDTPTDPPIYPIRCVVGDIAGGDPFWHAIDGNTVWTLTVEPNPPPGHATDPAECRSFAFQDASTPALVYETATLAVPGNYLSLTAYTAPGLRGKPLLTLRSIENNWWMRSQHTIRWRAPGSTRVRLYCDVLQTDPATRFNPSLSGTDDAICREDRFVLIDAPDTAYYALVAGRLEIERGGKASGKPKHRESRRIVKLLEELVALGRGAKGGA